MEVVQNIIAIKGLGPGGYNFILSEIMYPIFTYEPQRLIEDFIVDINNLTSTWKDAIVIPFVLTVQLA